MRNVENPARYAFSATCSLPYNPGDPPQKNCSLGALPEVPAGKIFVIQTVIGRCESTDLTARFTMPAFVINQGPGALLVTALPLGSAVTVGGVIEQQMNATNLFFVAQGSNQPRLLSVMFDRVAGTQSSHCRLYVHGYWVP